MSTIRETLLNFKPRTSEVTLPGKAGKLTIRELRASEVIDFTKDRVNDAGNAVYKLIIKATVDNDKPVFTMEDINAVAAMPYAITDAIVDAILEVSGLKDDAKKKQNPPSGAAQK